jgi:hypothetical protein
MNPITRFSIYSIKKKKKLLFLNNFLFYTFYNFWYLIPYKNFIIILFLGLVGFEPTTKPL